MGFENKQSATVLHRTYNKSTPLVIILLAYLHTGSSFTGSLLQQHPDTFYQFEPLRSLEIDFRDEGVIKYLNGSERFVSVFIQMYIHFDVFSVILFGRNVANNRYVGSERSSTEKFNVYNMFSFLKK